MLLCQEQLHNPVRSKGDGTGWLYSCPFCRGFGKLEVHSRKPVWYCHKCGKHGKFGGRKKTELAVIPRESGEYQPLKTRKLPHWEYLIQRVSEKLIPVLQPHLGPEFTRVYFPFYAPGSHVPSYFVGRGIFSSVKPRYMNPASGVFPAGKSRVLWGCHRFTQPQEHITLCEGIFSAIWFPDGLALLGKIISEHQINLLAQLCRSTITLVLDGDTRHEAAEAAWRIARRTHLRIERVVLPVNCDPDDLRGNLPKQRERLA